MDQNEFNKRYLIARRKAIAMEFSHLNDKQLDAVLTTRGPLLILAGAGSGKTAVLINRIANLIKYGSGSDSDIVPDNATPVDLEILEDYCKKHNLLISGGSDNHGRNGEALSHLPKERITLIQHLKKKE